MVVVLPDPFEPTKPKISPRWMRKRAESTAVKSPKRRVRWSASRAMGESGSGRLGGAGRSVGSWLLASLEEGEEGLLEGGAAGTREEVLRGAAGEGLAPLEGEDRVEVPRFREVGGGQEEGELGAGRAEPGDEFPELAPGEGIDAGGRLVEKKKVGVVDERTTEADLLLHAPAEVGDGPVAKGGQPGGLGERGDAFLPVAGAAPEEPGEEADIFPHAQRVVEVAAESLGEVGDPLAGAVAVAGRPHGTPENLDLTLLEAASPGDEGEKAGLADAVRPDQGDPLSSPHAQVDPGEGGLPAVAEPGPSDADHRGRRGGSCRGRTAGWVRSRIAGTDWAHSGSCTRSSSGQGWSGSRRM
jgi:hypothetical protein